MQARTSKPEKGNKFYIRKANGGYSTCVKGKPTDSCDVLANCVGYACGRFNEIIGSMKYPSLNNNAENFVERAKSKGLEVVNYPVLGGIMVWQKGATLKGSDGAGHVAIVERIDSADQIYTSESGYNSKAFWNSTRKKGNGNWGQASSYKFRGCIVNPTIGKNNTPTPSPTDSAYKTFVKGVQSSCGAKVDGIAGKETLSRTVTLSTKKNSKHKVVKVLQTYLISLGYSCGKCGADGIFGSGTKSAVKAYQKDHGCVVDGVITKQNKTWKKLLKLA